jgi:hypothetical protein
MRDCYQAGIANTDAELLNKPSVAAAITTSMLHPANELMPTSVKQN